MEASQTEASAQPVRLICLATQLNRRIGDLLWYSCVILPRVKVFSRGRAACPRRRAQEEPAVKSHFPMQLDLDNPKASQSLVERMDAAIGEATTVMGAVLTELLRRSLRGGVLQIGEELHTYVAERVDASLAERQPALEQAATEVAELAARTAATEVVHEEVKAVDQRVHQVSQDLLGRIDQTGKQAQEAVQQLLGQIAEAERRVSAATREEISQQVQTLLQRSREGAAAVRASLKALETAVADLAGQLQSEQGQRQHALAALRAEVERHGKEFHEQLTAAAAAQQTALNSLRQEMLRLGEALAGKHRDDWARCMQANRELTARVAELEKPRGLHGLFGKLFGKSSEANPHQSPPGPEEQPR